MDDNNRPHRANLVEDSFSRKESYEWNGQRVLRHEFKKHVCGRSRKTVACRQPLSKLSKELERALLEEWDRIPQLVINSLI
ncbi:hypothetical protein TNCV_1299131 [Trichonephila clavipes]|nr:hypothetical protein TNCV_1299131 [Trichonephila clavipes]